MNSFDVLQLILFVAALTLATKPLGSFMARVYRGEKTFLSGPLGWLERLVYKSAGVDQTSEMDWKTYAYSLMIFNVIGIFIVFLIQILQGLLPLNPQNLSGVSWHSALNTAVSFVTNTNWQGYAGETRMSYFTQMIALAVQNFISAAVGMSVAIALTRGIANRSKNTLGNFWADMTRGSVYILLPFSLVLALVLISEGVVQTFNPYLEITTLEGLKQILAFGPAASQIAIKMLGTNGGGFFNANAAHPFENPTPLSNFIQMLAIFIIPAALTYTYGVYTNARKHGWIIFSTMLTLFLTFTGISLWSEYSTNPVFNQAAMMIKIASI